MKIGMEMVFWLSAAALLYTYAGYPLLLLIVSTFRPLTVRVGDYQPTVSLIITAYNEELDLAAKLENTLTLDYPHELIDIIVASDCSTDRTDDIVRKYSGQGVKIVVHADAVG